MLENVEELEKAKYFMWYIIYGRPTYEIFGENCLSDDVICIHDCAFCSSS
jgi:hypothetical protein